MRPAWLILMLSAGSCFAQTPAVCPWLSVGSAADALGGPVESDLHIESSSQGTCRFLHGSGTEQESIEITIGKIDTHACPAGSAKLVGFGKEAVECKKRQMREASLSNCYRYAYPIRPVRHEV